jgi:hypothetical protein
MAKPRIFISSTYYDLKHIRSSLELFVESFGYEPVLSEKGDIAYTPDQPLDESCYREAISADIVVLIIGGRYGSEVSGSSGKPSRSFFDRYESITRKEFESSHNEGIPIYILIEKGVYSEYQTFQQNKENKTIKYAHVDSVNVFRLIEEILAKPRNNPISTFERFSEIEIWLREQWAGYFRELLRARSQQRQLLAISGQVNELKSINETLKTYLEAVMKGVSKDESTKLIESEEKRLEEAKKWEKLSKNQWCNYVLVQTNCSLNEVVEAIRSCKSFSDFVEILARNYKGSDKSFTQDLSGCLDTLSTSEEARSDFNEAREILGLDPIIDSDLSDDIDRQLSHTLKRKPAKKRTQ